MNKIEFEVGTYTVGEGHTWFRPVIKFGGHTFSSSVRYDTEEDAQAEIESLKSLLQTKPNKIKELEEE